MRRSDRTRRWLIWGLRVACVLFFSLNSVPGQAATIDVRVNQNNDDAEERVSDGNMSLGGSHLDLNQGSWGAGVPQISGMRFRNISIPQGATISNATIRFNAHSDETGTTSMRFSGQAIDDAPGFTGSAFNISNRTQTSATVDWTNVSDWNADTYYTSPDLTAIIQEIISRPGWSSGNDLVVMVEGLSHTARRRARTHNNDSNRAPEIHIEFNDPPLPTLLAHWWLDGSGVEYFSGVDAVPIGSPGFAPARVCDGFNGDGSGFLTSDVEPILDLPDQFTAMAWINPSSLSVSGHDSLYSFFSKDTNFEVHVRNDGSVFWWWGNGSLSTPAGTITPGNWYHIALVHSRSGGYQRLYVNGVILASDNRTSAMPVNDDLFLIGGDIATGSSSEMSGRRFYGLIDEVKVFGGPLSTAQILNEMNQNRVCQTPAAEWRFDECAYTGAANEAVDSASGAYPATAYNNVMSGAVGVVERFAELSDTGTRDNHFELATPLPLGNSWTATTWIQTPFTGTHRYHVLAAVSGGGDLMYLDRNNNYRWGVYTLGGLSTGSFEFGTLAAGWHHIALVGSGGNTTLYVDGSLVESVSRQTTGSLEFIGTSYDNVTNPSAAQGFGTPLDEFLVFGQALSATDISTIYNYQLAGSGYNGQPRATVNCGTGIDHFRLERLSASGLTCAASPITVRACADAACASEYPGPINATLLPASGWSGGNGKTNFASGTAFNLRNNASGSLTLGISSSTPTATNSLQCYVAGVAGNCTMEFFESGFLMDVQDFTSCESSAVATIAAVRRDLTTDQCVGIDSFANQPKTLDFYATRNNPNNGSQNVSLVHNTPVVVTAINTYAQDGSHPKTGTPITLDFDANAESTIQVRYSDAGRMGLYAGYVGTVDEAGLVMRQINDDTFVVAPHHLNVVATTDGSTLLDSLTPSGATHWPAGEDFQVDIEAVCSDGTVTPSFVWPIDLAPSAPSQPGTLGGLTATQILSGGFTNGRVSGPTAYTEVGTFTLQATADDYLGVSGLDITGSAGEIGRFTPYSFVVVTNTPSFSAASDTFSYLGQSFGYNTVPQVTVTAKNKQGVTTANYEGAWWQLTETSIGWNYTSGSGTLDTSLATGTVSPIGAGVGTLSFGGTFAMARSNPVAPFAAEIQLDVDVVDRDGIAYPSNPVRFGGTTSGAGIAFADGLGVTSPSYKNFLFGRLAILNAYGSELVDLPVPIRVEYYDGVGFQLNTLDNATMMQNSDILLTNTLGDPPVNAGVSIDVAAGIPTRGTWGNQPVSAGEGGFFLSAPGAGGTGDLAIACPLGGHSWLYYDWDGDGAHDDAPTGRASFGLYRGNPQMIYRRESVN